jgi:hypothetical protein
LTVSGAARTNRQAAAVYDDPSLEIAAFTLSHLPKPGQSTAMNVVSDYHAAFNTVAVAPADPYRFGFDTFDHRVAARAEYTITTSADRSAKAVRDELLLAMAPFEGNDVTGMPAATGAKYREFHVYVSSILREYQNGAEQVVTSLAVAPDAKYVARDKVQFRLDDLTNATNLAEAGDGLNNRCDVFGPKETPPTDFYWVLDQSGSMDWENDRLIEVANEFFNRLNNTALDYRLGVTSMIPSNEGRLRPNIGWHTDLETFIGEVNWVIGESGATERGIQMAHDGIEFMKGLTSQTPPQNERIRDDSSVVVIWMSDEESEYFKDYNNPLTTTAGQTRMNDHISFFEDNNATGFAIVGTETCGDNPTPDGIAYRALAHATGGSSASLCDEDLSGTIEDIIAVANAKVGYQLPQTPISSSLRVWMNGDWVPRSRVDGFDYSTQHDTIAFYGSYRPKMPGPGQEPDTIAVHYETWIDETKD